MPNKSPTLVRSIRRYLSMVGFTICMIPDRQAIANGVIMAQGSHAMSRTAESTLGIYQHLFRMNVVQKLRRKHLCRQQIQIFLEAVFKVHLHT